MNLWAVLCVLLMADPERWNALVIRGSEDGEWIPGAGCWATNQLTFLEFVFFFDLAVLIPWFFLLGTRSIKLFKTIYRSPQLRDFWIFTGTWDIHSPLILQLALCINIDSVSMYSTYLRLKKKSEIQSYCYSLNTQLWQQFV